jgi:hypothetical protein
MKNLEMIIHNLTDGTYLLEQLKGLLLDRDPAFALVAGEWDALVEAGQVPRELAALKDKQLLCGLEFALWQGMKLNLRIFRDPAAALALDLDYPELLRENILFRLPRYRHLQQQIEGVTGAMEEPLPEQAGEYYAYFETAGLKIAHYLGFRLGERVYPGLEPGYVADPAAAQRLRVELEGYLGIRVE